jgi:pimeloyl-ACP methyl ester carboxylesterase
MSTSKVMKEYPVFKDRPDSFKYFNMAGHSYGAYISAHYALKYPDKIKKLILVSPIGIRDPKNVQ